MIYLDKLQQGWSILNEELDNKEVVNKEAMQNKIEELRSKMDVSHRQVIRRNSISIGIGISFIVITLSTIFYFVLSNKTTLLYEFIKENVCWSFALPIICITILWDCWTKKQLQTLDPINSTIIAILTKTNKLLKYAVYEIYFLIFVYVIGSIFFYIHEGFYKESIIDQSVLICLYGLITVVATIFIRRRILHPLKQIKENAEDLHIT